MNEFAELSPRVGPYRNKIHDLLMANRYDEAEALTSRFARNWRHDPDALELHLAVIERKLETLGLSKGDEWGEILAQWKQLRELFPDRQAGYLAGGRACIRAGQFDLAEELLSSAIERFPDHPLSFYYYALSARARSDEVEALRRFQTARDRFPNFAPILEGERSAAASVAAAPMPEAIRLVVWDLDETFWKGTVTEGGIEYVQSNHDAVIELARRGIMNSILSKNDEATILPLLAEKGILDYFIFPSISWEPKGARLATLIETVQLRAPTVLFIDDNPNNRAEALAVVPGVQVENETFVSRILTDRRLKGKNDGSLSRLKQYKLMETRATDKMQAASSNEDFLRKSDIRILIDYNVDASIDRAIELINRTNQLNYTKRRLPEDIELARQVLQKEINLFDTQVGLVRVVDKYGDYGYIGFFMQRNLRRAVVNDKSNGTLLHYCFSCRTLGMYIEQWLYEHLGRPELDVVGEVLTDLSVPRKIDWVRLVTSLDDNDVVTTRKYPSIILSGGCETNAVGVYLANYADNLRVFGSYNAGGCFIRMESSVSILSIARNDLKAVKKAADALDLPHEMVANNLFGVALPGSLFVFNLGRDGQSGWYLRHKTNGMAITIEPRGVAGANFLRLSEAELIELSADLDDHQKKHVLKVHKYISEHFELSKEHRQEEFVTYARTLIESVPRDCKVIIACDHDVARSNAQLVTIPSRTRWTQRMRELVANYPNAGVVSYSEVIKNENEIQSEGNHYDRIVYLRFAHRLLEVATSLA